MTAISTGDRAGFLADLLITAIENCGYGQFETLAYNSDPATGTCATIRFEDDDQVHRVNPDTMAHGLATIRTADLRVDDKHPADGLILHNTTTGQRLYMSSKMRDALMLCDRTNGDEGDYDVIDALAVLEIALLGAVTYA